MKKLSFSEVQEFLFPEMGKPKRNTNHNDILKKTAEIMVVYLAGLK